MDLKNINNTIVSLAVLCCVVSVVSNYWTGLWAVLLDWTAGLDLFFSYHMTFTQLGVVNLVTLIALCYYKLHFIAIIPLHASECAGPHAQICTQHPLDIVSNKRSTKSTAKYIFTKGFM